MPKARRRSSSHAAAAKLAELSLAVPQVVNHRLTRMALAGPTPSARDRKEFTGMVLEKPLAFSQAWTTAWTEGFRLQQQWMLTLLSGASPATQLARTQAAAARLLNKSLAPVHGKAVANAKRLARTKRR